MSSEKTIQLTGKERTFGRDEIIVTKTNLTGHITYVNQVFCRVALYTENEALGKPHNIVRHPDMPRCIFKFLWDTIQAGKEIFAYVVNRAKNGDHYWVFAHVTPTFDNHGKIIGYHSNRRVPDLTILPTIKRLYRSLLDVESRYANPKDQMAASMPELVSFLESQGMSYDELIFNLLSKSNEHIPSRAAETTLAASAGSTH